jgi:hypothetical protein
MDASATQLGAVIAQDNRPIAFFSRKLFKTQQKYSITKIELLAIVETLKEFKGILWGQSIKVFTNHKNFTRDTLGLFSYRVYQWRLHLEEYTPKIIYLKVIQNTVVDAIMQLEYHLVWASNLWLAATGTVAGSYSFWILFFLSKVSCTNSHIVPKKIITVTLSYSCYSWQL